MSNLHTGLQLVIAKRFTFQLEILVKTEGFTYQLTIFDNTQRIYKPASDFGNI